MSENVIVILADQAYLPHAKSLMVNCRRQGNWQGDLCLLTAGDWDTSELRLQSRGISVLPSPDAQFTHITKFWIFTHYFRKWKRLLYLDCDCIVQGDLNQAFDDMAAKLPAILCDGGMEPEGGTVLGNWEHFDRLAGPGPESHPELYERMKARYSCMDKLVFTMDACFFAPDAIPPRTVDELQAVAEEFKEANLFGTDQAVVNLVLYDKMAPMTKDICTWFAFDEPANRVPCPARGWRGDEEPVILHYWNMYAPWIPKTPDAGGYFNHRLGRICLELYQENLAAFEEVFPVRG